MDKSWKDVVGVIAAAGLGLAVVASAHADPQNMGVGKEPHAQGGMQHGTSGAMGHGAMGHGVTGQGAGHAGLTAEERTAFQEKMRNAKTPEERQQIAEATRTEMQKRAQANGAIHPEHRGPGPGMMHGMAHGAGAHGHASMAGAVGMLTRQDAGSAADMDLVHELVVNHAKIKRTVTNLPNGIKTVTESNDPQVAQTIKAHVASMSQRLKDGREFNIFSKTLPVLFENRDKIKSVVEVTAKGTIVTRTSTDAQVVAALQGHASEVTELAQDGPQAMRRGMMARMAMGDHGPRAGAGSGQRFAPAFDMPTR